MPAVVSVFAVFLRLGLTSFGGPIAHLAYFRTAFVARRGWLTETDYAGLVALCQALPGPTSSQVGMAIGYSRAGWPGMLAAWLGFTLPSAVLLAGAALGLAAGMPLGLGTAGLPGWLLGVKAAVVAVVAHAVVGMARTLATGWWRGARALAAAVIALVVPGLAGQLGALGFGAMSGWLGLEGPAGTVATASAPPGRHAFARSLVPLAAFATLLLGLPALVAWIGAPWLDLFARFYRSGALVFGGGHVVLPLLNAELVDTRLVARADFLAGYGAAQAVPGPLFTVAAWLGVVAVANGAPGGLPGAALAVAGIFLPSLLLIAGIWPSWRRWTHRPAWLDATLAGVNTAVVGLLLAAFVDPVLPAGITSPGTALIALVALAALFYRRIPAWALVPAAALVGSLIL